MGTVWKNIVRGFGQTGHITPEYQRVILRTGLLLTVGIPTREKLVIPCYPLFRLLRLMILLDPNEPRLWRAIFKDDYKSVHILDCEDNEVCPEFVLTGKGSMGEEGYLY